MCQSLNGFSNMLTLIWISHHFTPQIWHEINLLQFFTWLFDAQMKRTFPDVCASSRMFSLTNLIELIINGLIWILVCLIINKRSLWTFINRDSFDPCVSFTQVYSCGAFVFLPSGGLLPSSGRRQGGVVWFSSVCPSRHVEHDAQHRWWDPRGAEWLRLQWKTWTQWFVRIDIYLLCSIRLMWVLTDKDF